MRLEINMIVSSAKEAGKYYEKVLGAEILSQTDLQQGANETMLRLAGIEVRLLDENKSLGLVAPVEGGTPSMSINLFVEDLDVYFANIESNGCQVLSPVTDFPHIPAKNAVFKDKFNHIWVVNQQY